jgi:hypothetical protein
MSWSRRNELRYLRDTGHRDIMSWSRKNELPERDRDIMSWSRRKNYMSLSVGRYHKANIIT